MCCSVALRIPALCWSVNGCRTVPAPKPLGGSNALHGPHHLQGEQRGRRASASSVCWAELQPCMPCGVGSRGLCVRVPAALGVQHSDSPIPAHPAGMSGQCSASGGGCLRVELLLLRHLQLCLRVEVAAHH